MPLFGPPNVEKLKEKGNVKGLIKALGYKKDESVRQQAVEALVEIGAPAVEPLTGALQDSNLQIKSGAVQALGQIGDARAIDALVYVLNDREETRSGILNAELRIRRSAAEALGRISDTRAVVPLTAALDDMDVRVAAMEALAQLDYELAVERFLADLSYYSESFYTDFYTGEDSERDNYIHLTAAEQLGQLGDARAVDPLIEMLDGLGRATVAEALGRIGDKRAVKPLAALLDDEDWKVVKAAAEALGRISDKRAVKPLIAALKDERNNVRSAAARALGQIGDKRAAKPLRALLQDDGLWVSDAASEALDQLGKPSADQLVADLEDKNQGVRERALDALCKMKGRAVPVLISALVDHRVRLNTVVDAITRIGRSTTAGPLLSALKSEEEATRQAVIQLADKLNWRPEDGEALAWYWITKGEWRRCSKVGNPAVGPLLTVLEDEDQDVRRRATWTLGEIGDARAVGPLATALQDENQSMRWTAVEALGKIGDAGAIAPLSDALQDEGEGVRHDAVEALAKIGHPAIPSLTTALEDASGWVREAAARALRIGDARAVPLLIAALDDEEEQVRRAAIWALGWIGDTRAVEPLIAILDDATAKREAAQALEQLKWQPPADETGARYWVAKSKFEKCVAIGAPAVPVLIAELKEGDRHVRDGASGALVQIGAPAVEPLLVAIQDEHWQVRRDAVKVLGQIGDTRATESLITAMADKTPDVSQAAAAALGEIGDVAEVELLNPARTLHSVVAALKVPSRSVRQAAAKVLIELYTSGRVPPKQKQLVLDQKKKIMERHTDRYDHTDYGKDCAPFDSHTDWEKHVDRGIGVDFPL